MTVRTRGEFIDGPAGALAVVLWEPASSPPHRAALYLPPFADEMNKARRIVATQGRALAAAGWAVAALDPRGTGDSAGEHAQATWRGWRDDARCAWQWLATRYPVPAMLWGLRLGAHLAGDLAADGSVSPAMLLLWQPLASARTFFQQQLRADAARGLVAQEAGSDARSLRARLQAGETVEIAGYEIHPDLVAGAERADTAAAMRNPMHVVVREVTSGSPPEISPGVSRLASRWREAGASVDVEAVAGAPFWAAQEIADVPALIAGTTTAVVARASEALSAPAT